MKTRTLQFKDLLFTLTVEQVSPAESPKVKYITGKEAELAIAKIEDAKGDYEIQHQAGVTQNVKVAMVTLIFFVSMIAMLGISGMLLSSFT